MPGNWTSEQVASKAVDVYEPSRRNEHGYVVIYLHGVHLNRLQDQPGFLAEFERHGLTVVCPWTERSWWTDRVCREFDTKLTAERHLLDNILPYVATRFGVATPKIALLGTSMGGQGALRFAYKYPNLFPIAAAISPAIDYYKRYNEGDETIPEMYDDPEAARQDSALLHIHPLNWPRHQFFCCDPVDRRWWESADLLHMKLFSLGVPHEFDLETSGGGHSFEYYSRMAPKAIEFLIARLDQERRRVA